MYNGIYKYICFTSISLDIFLDVFHIFSSFKREEEIDSREQHYTTLDTSPLQNTLNEIENTHPFSTHTKIHFHLLEFLHTYHLEKTQILT